MNSPAGKLRSAVKKLCANPDIAEDSREEMPMPFPPRLFRRMIWRVLSLSLVLFCANLLPGQDELAAYHPDRKVEGLVRVWGTPSVRTLLDAWETGFRRVQPGVKFENSLYGDDSAMGGIYTGAADVALMDRRPTAIEEDGFRQATGHPVSEMAVSYGSLHSSPGPAALVVFVHRSSPIRAMTLKQLEAVFSARPQNGSPPMESWKGLGMDGPRGEHSIHLYGFRTDSNEARAIENIVFGGSRRWNCGLHEFTDHSADHSAAGQIGTALASDPDGIAIGSLDSANRSIRVVAIASEQGRLNMSPSEATLRSGNYPLAQPVYLYFDRKPASRLSPGLEEFLRYVVSKEGQALIGKAASYLPLPTAVARQDEKELQP